jgi:uncharacterized membrane protein
MLGRVMRKLSQYRFKVISFALLAVALAIDLVAKKNVSYAALHFRDAGVGTFAKHSAIISICGALIACLAVCMWVVSFSRRERGSQSPIILLICVHCLIFFIHV